MSDAAAFLDGELAVAVADLSPQQRAVVALHYLDDMSVIDVAAAMSLSDGAVKYHLHQARDSLAHHPPPRPSARGRTAMSSDDDFDRELRDRLRAGDSPSSDPQAELASLRPRFQRRPPASPGGRRRSRPRLPCASSWSESACSVARTSRRVSIADEPSTSTTTTAIVPTTTSAPATTSVPSTTLPVTPGTMTPGGSALREE